MNIEIANRLVDLRKKNGLSQDQLAEKLGLSRQAISKWERAEASPDTDNLICLAKLYGISLDDLLNTDQSLEEIKRNVQDQQEEIKKQIDVFDFSNFGFARVHIDDDGIEFLDEDDDEIESIQPINEEYPDGSSVSITQNSLDIKKGSGGELHADANGFYFISDGKKDFESKEGSFYSEDGEIKFVLKARKPIAIITGVLFFLALAAYLLMGLVFCKDNPRIGWGCWWVLFLIPIIFNRTADSIRERNPKDAPILFCVLFAYIPLGFYMDLWHPMWVLFLLVPIWSVIFSKGKIVIRKKTSH